MKNKFEKNDLIFYYQEYDFPSDLIAKDVIIHRELILNEESEEPELARSNKKIKYSACFIIEEELELKGKGGFKKGIQSGKNYNKPVSKPKENVWRKNEPEENSGGFFDNFNGKSDEKQVAKFKRNIEVHVANENSISIEKSIFIDHSQKPKQAKVENTLKFYEVNKEESKAISADNFFDNADKIMGIPSPNNNITPVDNKQKSKLNEHLNNNIDPNPKIVNIDLLFKINEYLQYPKEEQLWYIFHPGAKSSFGPLSSPNIKQMYESNLLNGQSEIRFIDIYNLKNKKPFAFFLLKEIEHSNFIEEIEISPLLRVAVAIKSKNSDKKEDTHKTTTKAQVAVSSPVHAPLNPCIPNPTPIQISSAIIPIKENKYTNQVVAIKNEINNQNDSIYNIPSNNQSDSKNSEPEKKSIVETFFDEIPSTTVNQPNKKKKLYKGKPVDIDIKLGFKLEDENLSKSNFNKPNNFNTNQIITQQPVNNNKNRNYNRENNNNNNNHYHQQNNNNFYDNYNEYTNQEETNYDHNNYYQNNNYAGGSSIYNNNYRNNNYYKK